MSMGTDAKGSKASCHVAAGICFYKNKVLMGRRIESETRFAEFWEFPGGKIEEGESETEALQREFVEELGCGIAKTKHFDTFEWDYPDRIIRLYFYLVKLEHHELEKFELSAHSKLNWYSLDDALREQILPANQKVIKKLIDSPQILTSFFE